MIRLRQLILFVFVGLAGFTILIFGDGVAGAQLSTSNEAALQGSTIDNRSETEGQFIEWLQETKIMATDAQAGDLFGASVAINGGTIVVGASGEGAAYIFEQDQDGSGTWSQTAKLTADDAQEFDAFGHQVAISGDTVVIGADGEDGGPGDPLPQSGAAYIFERNQGGPGAWGQTAKLTADDAQMDDMFGFSVAISGDTIVVGAFEEDGGPGDPLPQSGAAYVFERNQGGAGAWGQTAKLAADDAQASDWFGSAAAISGDTILIGAFAENGGPGDPHMAAGAAYVFERDQGGPGAWGQTAKLTAGDAQASDVFGESVAISGDTIIVGAAGEDGGPGDPLSGAGAAYVFQRNQGGTGNWGQVVKLSAGDSQSMDDFGSSVGVSGDRVVIGASGEDGGPGDPLLNAGAAYIFEQDQGGPGAWGQTTKLSAGDAQKDDLFGSSTAVDGSTVVVGSPNEDGGPGNPLTSAGAAYIFEDFWVYLPVIISP